MRRFFFAALVGGFLSLVGCGASADDPTTNDPSEAQLGTVESAEKAFADHAGRDEHARHSLAGHAHIWVQAWIDPVTGLGEIDLATGDPQHTQHSMDIGLVTESMFAGNINHVFIRVTTSTGKFVRWVIFSSGGIPGGGCIHLNNLTGLAAGEKLEVIALIKDVPLDGKRTDIVGASATIMGTNPGN